MFVPFLIMLREGLEAALIVSLIASYLKRTQRGRWIGVMWIGVLLAAALCLGLGIFINETTGEFPQKEQELFEGIVAVIAVVILTWMVFWMRKVSRNVKVQLEQAVDSALQRGNHHGWALVMMVLFCRCKGRAGVGLFPAGGISTRCRDLAAAGCNARSCYCRGARLLALLGRYSPQSWCTFLNGPACLFSSSPQGWQLVPFAHFMKPDCGTTFRKSPSI